MERQEDVLTVNKIVGALKAIQERANETKRFSVGYIATKYELSTDQCAAIFKLGYVKGNRAKDKTCTYHIATREMGNKVLHKAVEIAEDRKQKARNKVLDKLGVMTFDQCRERLLETLALVKKERSFNRDYKTQLKDMSKLVLAVKEERALMHESKTVIKEQMASNGRICDNQIKRHIKDLKHKSLELKTVSESLEKVRALKNEYADSVMKLKNDNKSKNLMIITLKNQVIDSKKYENVYTLKVFGLTIVNSKRKGGYE